MADLQVALSEEFRRERITVPAGGIEIELVDQDDIGCGPPDDLGDRLRLRVVRCAQVVDQRTAAAAIEGSVEGGHTKLSAHGLISTSASGPG